MPNIVIRDLDVSKEIDRKAMANIMGGAGTWVAKKKLGETYLGTRVDLADGWLYHSYKVRYQKITFEDYEEIVEKKVV